MNWKIKDNFAITFDFMCKCHAHKLTDFIFAKKDNHMTLLCKHCEKKFVVKMYFEEM